MNPVIPLVLVPFSLRGQEMIGVLWLKASTLNEFATIGPVGLVGMILLEKNQLDVMIPLIAGAINPNALCLVYRWDSHGFSPLWYSLSTLCVAKGTSDTCRKARTSSTGSKILEPVQRNYQGQSLRSFRQRTVCS
jgi:hypothetical protein